MRAKILVSTWLVLLLALCATPAYAIPALPHAFYGTVTINDGSAPVDTEVSAIGTGVLTNTIQNPITTTVVGQYGSGGLYLLVHIPPLATITFYVDGHLATTEPATVLWHSGETSKVDLSVAIAAPTAPPEAGAPGLPLAYIETTLFGIETRFRISDEGEILRTIEVTSADGMLTITIPKGTIALDKDGDPLESLEAAIDPSPPDPPEGAHIIGLTYNFGPDGATFDPAITLTWNYDPDDVPEDVAEEDLVVALYDVDAAEWEECECTCDPATNCVTACVCHFTCFAIITPPVPAPPLVPAPAAFSLSNLSIQPAEVQPEEAVTIAVSVANTGGTRGSYTVALMINGVKEAEKSVTVAAGDSRSVSFTVSKEDIASYSVVVDGLSGSFTVVAPLPPAPPPPAPPPEVKAPINWPLIGGIIAGVIVVGLLIFFLVRRRAY